MSTSKDEKTETKATEAAKEPVDLAEILKPMAGQIVTAKVLGAKLKAGGHSNLESLVSGLIDAGKLRALGQGEDADDSGSYRFAVAKAPAGGKIWVRALYGPAVEYNGYRFDRVGKAVEVDGATREAFESRGVPVEVIAKPAEVAELEAKAKKLASAEAVVVDKRADALAGLG